jgi:integrase
MTLKEYFEQTYVQARRPTGARQMRNSVNRFVDFLGGDPDINKPTAEDAARFRDWLIVGLAVAKSSARAYANHVRIVLRHARPKDFPILERPNAKRIAPARPPEGDRYLDRVLYLYCQEHELKIGSIEHLEYAEKHFSKWLGRRATIDDFNHETLNAFLIAEAPKYRPNTMKRRRSALLTLWRWCYDEAGTTWNPPRRVRKIKVPYEFPEAWSEQDLLRLMEAAEKTTGTLKDGTPIRLFWRAWLAVAYDTGLRPCDLLTIRRDAVTDKGVVTLVQEKTGFPLVASVRPETLVAIGALGVEPDAPLFGALRSKHGIYFRWGRLLQAAGLSGTPKKVRKTSASLLERDNPGAAMAHLGHRTPGLAAKHYIDPRVASRSKPLPPRIVEGGAA